MERKSNSSVGSRAQDNGYKKLSFEDKYFALKFKNQELRRKIRKIGEAFHDEREKALQYRAERDLLMEQLQDMRGNHAL